MSTATPIAIVGAGPVGLVLALKLATLGVPSVVLESEPDISEELRASTFHPPSLDMLAELGLAAPLIAQARKDYLLRFAYVAAIVASVELGLDLALSVGRLA